MNSDFSDVGRFIAFGLDPKLVPGQNGAYADLVARFRNEPEFRAQVESLAFGQGLDVLECSPVYGLVLTATGVDSPYHMRLDEYAAMSSTEERHLNALTFLAIATACYPTAESLEAEDGPLSSVTVNQVVRLMNRMAERIRERGRDVDPPVEEPQLEPLYRM